MKFPSERLLVVGGEWLVLGCGDERATSHYKLIFLQLVSIARKQAKGKANCCNSR